MASSAFVKMAQFRSDATSGRSRDNRTGGRFVIAVGGRKTRLSFINHRGSRRFESPDVAAEFKAEYTGCPGSIFSSPVNLA